MISKELRSVVDAILVHHREFFRDSLSPMKLQKMCYYVQGIYMATHNGEHLFEEDFEAWTYGPVIRSLYSEFKEYGWKNIADEVSLPEIDKNKLELIQVCVEVYGQYDGGALSTMTHREKPWIDARKGLPETQGSNAIIPKEAIRNFFEERLSMIEGITQNIN